MIQRMKPIRRPRKRSVKLKWTIQQLHDAAGEIHLPQDSNDRQPPVTQWWTSKLHKNREYVDYESYYMLYELMVSEFSLNQKMRVNLIYKNLGNILTA
jgi:hypothetical protein